MNDELLSMLGLARRAGRLSPGFDAAADAMKKRRACLLLLANDLSRRTFDAAVGLAVQNGVEYVRCSYDMQTLGKAIGRRMTGIISVDDGGFAKKLKAICADNRQEECIDD